MMSIRKLAFAFALLLFGAAAPAFAQTFPKFTGYVVDRAGVLMDGQEIAVANVLGMVERVTRHQVAVAIVPALEGVAVEDYARRLGNHWGVGRRGVNDGVLLLVAPSERRVRIAVGEGLRSKLTDAEAAAIIRDRILPRFREGRLAAGILSGCAGIVRELAPRGT